MVFNYDKALLVAKRLREEFGEVVTRRQLAQVLREETKNMMPWWIKTYAESMVTAGLLELQPDGTFKVLQEV